MTEYNRTVYVRVT